MTILQEIFAALNWNVRVTENFRSVSPAGLYGINPTTTTGLVLGLLGGQFNGVTVADGTVTLTASATNYVVANRTTGAPSVATSTTNWNNTTDYMRLYQLVAGATTFTIADTSDKRQAYGAGGGGSGGTVAAEDVTYDNTASGLTATDAQGALDELAGAVTAAVVQCLAIACSDETTTLTTGAAKVTFRMPYAFTLTEVRASLTTSGTGVTVDINEAGASILSTKLTIDSGETTSVTAAVPPVISDSSLANDAEITIDLDVAAGAGLKVYLIGYPT